MCSSGQYGVRICETPESVLSSGRLSIPFHQNIRPLPGVFTCIRINMKSRILISAILLLCSMFRVSAQDEPQFSQYMAAPVLFNPAAAGLDQAWNSALLVRNQWVGLPGAPTTQAIATELPVYRIRSGISLRVMNDRAGQQNTTVANIGYSYQLRAGSGLLGLGVHAGIASRSLDGSRLIAPDGSYEAGVDHNDDQLPVTLVSSLIPDAGAGFFFRNERLQAGLSVTHLAGSSFSFDAPGGSAGIQYHPVGYVFVSWKVLQQENWSLEPGVLYKTDLTEQMLDANLLFSWRETLLAGLSLRSLDAGRRDALVAMGGWNFSKYWGIRYSYDLTLSALNNAQSGSHELVLTYRYPLAPPRAGKEINNLRYLYY